MVDPLHYHYTVGVDELHFRLGSDTRIDRFKVSYLTSLIREVRLMIRGPCSLKKSIRRYARMGRALGASARRTKAEPVNDNGTLYGIN